MGTIDNKVTLLYDSECPVCRNYAIRVRIQESVGNLVTLSGRDQSQLRQEVTRLGWDLDNGMVLKLNNKLYFGNDAIHILALISTRHNLFNKLNYWLFRSSIISSILYPICKFGRNVLLKILGVTKIHNLENF